MSDPSVRKKPSWVEPVDHEALYQPFRRSDTKQAITIRYSDQGTQPPVYVATSFTNPPWEPIEMEHISNEDGFEFYRSFLDMEEGTHQYKFRLGPGDWWVLDKNKPTVHDNDGNENNLLVVQTETLEDRRMQSGIEDETGGIRTRIDSVSMPKTTETPGIMINEVDTKAVDSFDQNHNAAAEQGVAPSLHDTDDHLNKTDMHSTEQENKQSDTQSFLGDPREISLITSHEALKALAASHIEYAPHAEAEGHADTYESPVYENAPLFAHERMDEPYYESQSPPMHLISNGRASGPAVTPKSDSTEGVSYNFQSNHEPPCEAPPLFMHECASSEDELYELPLKPEPDRIPRRFSSALKHVELASDDEKNEQLSRDPSVERFPDTREDIMMHLHETESRFGYDQSDRVEGTPPSPLRSKNNSPRLSRTTSDASHSAVPSLNDITEEPIPEDDEAENSETQADKAITPIRKLPSTGSKRAKETSISNSIQEQIATRKQSTEKGQIVLDTAIPAVTSPPTPPMTPEEALKANQNVFTRAPRPEENIRLLGGLKNPAERPRSSIDLNRLNEDKDSLSSTVAPAPVTDGAVRQRRPEPDGNIDDDHTESSGKSLNSEAGSRTVTPSSNPALFRKRHESFLHVFWRVLFGSWLVPLGHWMARLCGGRRNVAGILALGLVATWATGFNSHLSDIFTSLGGRERN